MDRLGVIPWDILRHRNSERNSSWQKQLPVQEFTWLHMAFMKFSLMGKKLVTRCLHRDGHLTEKDFNTSLWCNRYASKGTNAIGALLGDGWYRGTLAWGNNWAVYGKKLGLLLQLKIIYTDGSESLVTTDETWKASSEGAIRMNDIYNGETFDATRNLTGWSKPDIMIRTGKM